MFWGGLFLLGRLHNLQTPASHYKEIIGTLWDHILLQQIMAKTEIKEENLR